MSKKITRQIDLAQCGLHVRESDQEGRESRTVEGHAVVFGQRSANLVPWSRTRELYEVMEPGCITNELISRSDVVLTSFHLNSNIMGRSVNGKGTLSLSLDGKGMKISCDLPRTSVANDSLELIRRGDITGMSFAYSTDEDDINAVTYERLPEQSADHKDIYIRHVKRVDDLYDVTIAAHPAYPQTDIAQREIDTDLDKALGLVAKEEERLEREKKEREEEDARKSAALADEIRRRQRCLDDLRAFNDTIIY